ncbi:Ger(x)C family spore germination protein [Salipaludibacillus sp. CF4.18]|uniref:Ger(x)C family spore germination protein n=1 Tax=Salipaludibacillus sp. CF4.18 TaxID=3373081 RepID=UPI003EE6A67A
MKIFLCFISLFLLTGCWDRNELTDVGIVVGMAIDKDPDTGDFILTSQYLRPAAESTQTPTPDRPYLMVSTTGKTISEVMRKANQTIDRRSFFAHNKVIIISEDAAREGLIQIIDTFQRGKEVRGYVWFSIAKDIGAKELLEIKANNIARVPANFLNDLFDNTEHNATAINLLTYYKKTLGAGINPVVSVLTREETDIEPFELLKLSGSAVFKEDKLVGFLDESETRGYNWITEEGPPSNRGAIYLPSLLQEDKFVTILLKEINSKIIPKVENGDQISFTIEVDQKASLIGQEATVELKNRKQITQYLNQIQGEGEKEIEKEIKKAIGKAQQDFQSDIFGFGEALNKEYPKVWNKEKDNWAETFAEVPYTVNVHLNIRSSGLIQGPFKPQE